MDIYTLKQHLPALQQLGHTLDTPERLRLEMGLLKLTQLANSDQLLFWGKIITTGQPYYIAQGIDFKDHYAFPHKKFYYSCGGSVIEFKQFPPLDQFNKGKVDNYHHLPFSGDPNQVLFAIPEAENQGQVDGNAQVQSEEEEIVKIVPKNYTELDRLAYTVLSIEIQCQVVPVGGFRITEKHELRYNQGFQGLKLGQIGLDKFQYFRYPLSEEGVRNLERPQSIFMSNFLQPIRNESEWSIQTNTTKDLATVRNFVWQGYVAYHRLGTKSFGGVYYGNGIKNVDVAFYI